MSKSTKIVVFLLIVAGFVCLAIGTIFACDYISQSNNSFALDKKQVIVASAERFALPNVRIDEPMQDIEVPDGGFPAGTYKVTFSQQLASQYISEIYCYSGNLDPISFVVVDTDYVPLIGFIGSDIVSFSFDINVNLAITLNLSLIYGNNHSSSESIPFVSYNTSYLVFSSSEPFYFTDVDDVLLESLPFDNLQPYVAPSNGVSIVGDLVGILTSGLIGIGQGLGESLSPIATSIFVNSAGDGFSVFGILIAVFAAVSLGLSFTRFVLNFVTSWGNRNR